MGAMNYVVPYTNSGQTFTYFADSIDSTNNYRFEIIANMYFVAAVHEFCWGNKIKIV